MELNKIINDFSDIFDFEYDFYTNDLDIKRNFEKKFINHYYFYEIGFESVYKWKWYLKSKLDLLAPYYKEMYNTILRSYEIDFMLNKDYTETFIREIETENNTLAETNNNTIVNNLGKSSNINNGLSSVSLEEKNLTNIDKTEETNNTNQTTKQKDNNNQTETNTLVGKGNIGTTSSADLLIGWRESIINIDNMIIEELRDLFLLIY